MFSWKAGWTFSENTFKSSDSTIVYINQPHSFIEDLRHVTLQNPGEINKGEGKLQRNMPLIWIKGAALAQSVGTWLGNWRVTSPVPTTAECVLE